MYSYIDSRNLWLCISFASTKLLVLWILNLRPPQHPLILSSVILHFCLLVWSRTIVFFGFILEINVCYRSILILSFLVRTASTQWSLYVLDKSPWSDSLTKSQWSTSSELYFLCSLATLADSISKSSSFPYSCSSSSMLRMDYASLDEEELQWITLGSIVILPFLMYLSLIKLLFESTRILILDSLSLLAPHLFISATFVLNPFMLTLCPVLPWSPLMVIAAGLVTVCSLVLLLVSNRLTSGSWCFYVS